MGDILFRNGEVVYLRDTKEFGTIVCSGDCRDDDILSNHEKALVLLAKEFKRDIHDNCLRDVCVSALEKQYGNQYDAVPTLEIPRLPHPDHVTMIEHAEDQLGELHFIVQEKPVGGTDMSSIFTDFNMLSELEEATEEFERICDHALVEVAISKSKQFDNLIDRFSEAFAEHDGTAVALLSEIKKLVDDFKKEIFP